MFTIDLIDLKSQDSTTYQLDQSIGRIGAGEDSDLFLQEFSDLGFELLLTKDLGSNFKCEQVFPEDSISEQIGFSDVYEHSAKVNLGEFKLIITNIESDLQVAPNEDLGQAGYRLMKKALDSELTSLPALKVFRPREHLFSFSPDQSVTIGRGGDADLIINKTDVSTHHARFGYTDGEYWVEDLGSTNGTFVNGNQVSGKVNFNAGDRVSLGASTVVSGLNEELLKSETQDKQLGTQNLTEKIVQDSIEVEDTEISQLEESSLDDLDLDQVVQDAISVDSVEDQDFDSVDTTEVGDEFSDLFTSKDTLSMNLHEANNTEVAPVVLSEIDENYPVLISTSKLARPAKLILHENQPVVIGRDPSSGYWLGAPFVSREHCQITYLGEGLLEIIDMSSNGTGYSQGTIASGATMRFQDDSDVLHFGSGLAVAFCFDHESEQRFLDNEGKVDTFFVSTPGDANPKMNILPKGEFLGEEVTKTLSGGFQSTFKPLRQEEEEPIQLGFIDNLLQSNQLKSKLIIFALGIVVLFVFVCLIYIISLFL